MSFSLYALIKTLRTAAGRIRPLTIVITNDPDHGKVDQYRRVFDALNELDIVITTAVFCRQAGNADSELARHCPPGDTQTLFDDDYRELMLEQQRAGHEIAFHGYSPASNTRQQFMAGLDLFKQAFGAYPFTYVEHGGNPASHPAGMCKKETLAVEGRNAESPCYVWDIIRQHIGCVWTWDGMLDDDYRPKTTADLFYLQQKQLFFRRARMHYLERLLAPTARLGGTFIGYTHFGYEGYRREPGFRLEHWTGEQLPAAIKELKNLRKYYDVTFKTVRDLALELKHEAPQNHFSAA